MDFEKYCDNHKTRPLPRYGGHVSKRNKVIEEIGKAEKTLSERAEKNIENTYYSNPEAHIHEEESVMINPLSWDKIEKAEGKARAISQGALMGSASKVSLAAHGQDSMVLTLLRSLPVRWNGQSHRVRGRM